MCGIAGIIAFKDSANSRLDRISSAVEALLMRGPDAGAIYQSGKVSLGHRRLAIIDTSPSGSQPFSDETGRYTIVFNGEFFNYREHRNILQQQGVQFRSSSDTEVLLHLYIRDKQACLEKINGFFAFAVYDKLSGELFLARDRFGVKPLLIYQDDEFLAFSSEMKSLFAFGFPKTIDFTALKQFFHLNYIPAPFSVFQHVRKLLPGHWIKIHGGKVEEKPWYEIPHSPYNYQRPVNYQSAKDLLIGHMEEAVKLRLISDVPLGAFLSGGLDSSIIVALASRFSKNLNTFSIGFRDESLFDETYYANLVASRYKTNHHVFSLTNDDLFEHIFEMLDYLDEPFADSSALAVYILSKETRKYVTVALSGDGADEMFGGYIKHFGEWRIRNGGWKSNFAGMLHPLWSVMPKSRNSAIGNFFRKLYKFSIGMKLNAAERYWNWCGYGDPSYLGSLINFSQNPEEESRRIKYFTRFIRSSRDLNEVFLSDMHLVLQGDMLQKVDLMSMANSLEVRTPFLDYHVVNFAFSLPEAFKIDHNGGKKILRDAFRPFLPDELFSRPKHGFEVPLLKWFRNELNSRIFDDLLGKDYIHNQGLFHFEAIKKLKQTLHSQNPGDSIARIWALFVFQHWWRKWMN